MLSQRRESLSASANMCQSGGKDSVLVVHHGSIRSGIGIDDAWVAGFVDLFPGDCGPEDPSSQKPVSFKRRARASFNRRHNRSRKNRYYLFSVVEY